MTRIVRFVVAGSLVCGCSSSSKGFSATDGDAGDGGILSCQSDELILEGPGAETPHGYFGLSEISVTNESLNATLPGGGSIQLSWSGDATAGPVMVIGDLAIATGPSTTTTWCLASPSTLQMTGNQGILDLRVQSQTNGVCAAIIDAGADYEPLTGCFDVAS